MNDDVETWRDAAEQVVRIMEANADCDPGAFVDLIEHLLISAADSETPRMSFVIARQLSGFLTCREHATTSKGA